MYGDDIVAEGLVYPFSNPRFSTPTNSNAVVSYDIEFLSDIIPGLFFIEIYTSTSSPALPFSFEISYCGFYEFFLGSSPEIAASIAAAYAFTSACFVISSP